MTAKHDVDGADCRYKLTSQDAARRLSLRPHRLSAFCPSFLTTIMAPGFDREAGERLINGGNVVVRRVQNAWNNFIGK